jgi:hypothetical protein
MMHEPLYLRQRVLPKKELEFRQQNKVRWKIYSTRQQLESMFELYLLGLWLAVNPQYVDVVSEPAQVTMIGRKEVVRTFIDVQIVKVLSIEW